MTRRTALNDWHMLYRRGAHCAPTQRHIERVLGRTWCAPAVRQGADELHTVYGVTSRRTLR